MDTTLPTYDEYAEDWKRRHKASLPRRAKVSSFQEIFWIVFWLLVASGAAVFSAAHTIPAAELTLFRTLPYRSYLAITAFVIVELVIFGAAAKRYEIKWLRWLMWSALIVAVIGNTSSSARAVWENGGDGYNQIGGFLLSVIAPATAWASGEVLHIQLANLAAKHKTAEDEYMQQWKDVEAKINSAFTKLEREHKHAIDELDRHEYLSIHSRQTADRQRQTGRGDATDKAVRYLYDNPGSAGMTLRELADAIGVGKDSVAKAKVIFSQNGHAESIN